MLRQMKYQPEPIRRLEAGLISQIAAHIAPHLPPTSTDKRRAVPPPTVRAREIAARLAPYAAAELLTANLASFEAARASALQATVAKAQELAARLDRLEARHIGSTESRTTPAPSDGRR